MFGNNGFQFTPGDWQQLGLTAGLSMLANNNGNRSVGQLIGRGGLDALSGLHARKMYEEKMARQKLEEERANQLHELDVQERQSKLNEAKRIADLHSQYQKTGDLNILAGLDPVAHAKLIAKTKPIASPAGFGVNYNTPFGKELGKGMSKKYFEFQDAAEDAGNQLRMLDEVEAALDSGIYTGFGGEVVQGVRKGAAAIGLQDEKYAAAGDTLERAQNTMSLIVRNPESGMGMPGAISEKDLEFLKATQAGLTRTPMANRQFVDAARKVQLRRQQVAQMATDYIKEHGQLDPGFYERLRTWSEQNRLFPDVLKREEAKTSSPHLSAKDGGNVSLSQIWGG